MGKGGPKLAAAKTNTLRENENGSPFSSVYLIDFERQTNMQILIAPPPSCFTV